MRVACLGPRGTFTHMAAERLYPGASTVFVQTHADAVLSCARLETDAFVAALSNSVADYIGPTVQALLSDEARGLRIDRGAVSLVSFSLYRPPQAGALKVVYSHPAALAQVGDWLRRSGARAVETDSTVAALALIALEGDPVTGAVGPAGLGPEYGLDEVEVRLEGESRNQTRFIGGAREAPLEEAARYLVRVRDAADIRARLAEVGEVHLAGRRGEYRLFELVGGPSLAAVRAALADTGEVIGAYGF